MSRIQKITIENFSPGLNTYDPVTILKPGVISDCENVSIFGQGIGSRLGRLTFFDTGNPSPIHSIFQFVEIVTGFRWLVFGQGTSVYAWNQGTDPSTLALLDTARSGEPLSFAVLNNKLHYADGLNKVRVWDGTAPVSDLAAALTPRSIFEYKGSLYLCGIVGAVNVLRWSDVNDPTTWPTANQLFLNDNDSEGLVGAAPYFNQLAVFKRSKVYLLDGLPVVTNRMLLPHSSGCVSRRTITITPGGPAWLWEDGFYAFVEGVPKKISSKIDSIFETMNPARLSYASAGYLKNVVVIAVSTGSSAYEDTILHLDTKKGGWTTNPGFNASAICNIMDTANIERQLHGGPWGRIFRAFFGTTDIGDRYRSRIRLSPLKFQQEVSLLELTLHAELFSAHGLDISYKLDVDAYSSPTINIPNPDPGAVYDASYFDTAVYAAGDVYRIPKRIGGKCRQVEFEIFTPGGDPVVDAVYDTALYDVAHYPAGMVGPAQAWKLHRFELSYMLGGR